MAALARLQAQGQSVLDGLAQMRLDTLLRFQQDLSTLNGFRQRAYRLPVQDIAGQFLVSDMLDIDQAATSATVRADSSSVTLRKRSSPAQPTVQSTQFSTSAGSIEQFSGMYRVSTQDGRAPTGTFDIQFFSGSNLTLLIFDIVMSPSDPAIAVLVSAAGVSYEAAKQLTRNGYRVSAWLPQDEVKYVRIAITPSHPDTLGGSSYTFGLTSFSAYMVDFQMQSEFATKTIQVTPGSSQMQLVAEDGDGFVYSLSLGAGAPYTGVAPGQILNVPGAIDVNGTPSAYLDPNGSGMLWWKDETGTFRNLLPASLYKGSLSITDAAGAPVRLAPGLNPAFASHLTVPVFAIYQAKLFYCPVGTGSPLFCVSYTAGPATVPASLLVQLTTRDRAATPVFQGASLQNIY